MRLCHLSKDPVVLQFIRHSATLPKFQASSLEGRVYVAVYTISKRRGNYSFGGGGGFGTGGTGDGGGRGLLCSSLIEVEGVYTPLRVDPF